MFKYELLHTCKQSGARLGKITTDNGTFYTPIFMPVGTQGTIKTLSSDEIYDISDGVVLANTYHLFLSPGEKILENIGGIKKYMNYNGIMLTDSGGFQVFSLRGIRKIKDEGVYFNNPKNGDTLFLSPERSIEIQKAIGADIIMSFDECPPIDSDYQYLKKSIDRTVSWAVRGLEHKKLLKSTQALFGIVQGGLDPNLREYCAKELIKNDFDGYSIGGLAIGEKKEEMYKVTKLLNNILPTNKPRYLMGVGAIDDLLENIKNGVDMFDCVLPSRNARHGMFYNENGYSNIKKSCYTSDFSPLDTTFNHKYSTYSKSYLRHLYKNDEALVSHALTYHNLYFMKDFMSKVRTAIKEDRLLDFIEEIKRNTNFYTSLF
jgi:queuine tRNA-ribosyltransferase